MNLSRLALVAIATARLTRFITSDKLGEWWLVGPLKRWAWRRGTHGYSPTELNNADPVPTPDPRSGWRSKLVSGLDCPFCVGFWIGAAVLLGEVLTGRTRLLRGVWTFTLAALGLNYAVGHLSSRVD